MTFIDELESSEEEISKKIRYFKKNLKKIFYPESPFEPEFFIKFVDNYACQKIDLMPSVAKEVGEKKLSFIGAQGLFEGFAQVQNIFEDSCFLPEYFPRGLMTLENFSSTTL